MGQGKGDGEGKEGKTTCVQERVSVVAPEGQAHWGPPWNLL